jgi:hypothetical protein
MTGDKRDECGCHRGCTWLPHDCAVPCVWPDCLTEGEHRDLVDAIEDDADDRRGRNQR